MNKKQGKQTVFFAEPVSITATSSIVGPKEGGGPIARFFDEVLTDILCMENTWEKAESAIVKKALETLLKKSLRNSIDLDYIIAGDLLNQSISSTFGIRGFNVPYFGLFGACSTMGEALALGAMLIDGDYAERVAAMASSHFCAAEKQFRYPLELGTQRTLSSTWTVTGAGAALLSKTGPGPYIKGVTTGKIVDLGIRDVNNMGAAMAPAAADIILNHLSDTRREPSYYDVIATGDLGYVGSKLCVELLRDQDVNVSANHTDCGILIFDREKQDTHAGGSGCGCSAVTFCGYFYDKLIKKEINRLLFIPTGALLSPTSAQQGESIPGIAHAVIVEN